MISSAIDFVRAPGEENLTAVVTVHDKNVKDKADKKQKEKEEKEAKLKEKEDKEAEKQRLREEKLKEKSIVMRLDSFIDPGKIRSITGVVRELYAAEGYQFAEVRPEVKPVEKGRR